MQADNPEETPKIWDSPVMLVTFNGFEEFMKAAKEPASAEKDIAHLAALSEVSLPVGIPEGYELYKIVAGSADIAFYYMPKEYLIDETTCAEAEATLKHYMFVDSRDSYDLDTLITQVGGQRSDLVDGKYYIHDTITSTVVMWEENEKAHLLYLPSETTFSSAAAAAANPSLTYSQLDTICKTQVITIDRNVAAE